MRFIDADDAMVADFLAALLELVAESGGWLNPQARLVERGGELSVQCDAPDDDPLVVIPRAVMVRVGLVDWAIRDGLLEIQGVPDDMVGMEREALYLMAGILNQCGKPAALASSHPVLAPVIDMLNHSCAAGGARPQGDGLAVEVRRTGEECFLDYGYRRDAIGMAVVYGFADASAVVAHSAPLEIAVAGIGQVVVSAHGRDASGSLRPIAARVEEDATVLSRVSFGPGCEPVSSVARATGWSDLDSRSAVEAIATANLDLLGALERAAAPFALAGAAAGRTLAESGRMQGRLIEGALP